MDDNVAWPNKTREIESNHFNSTAWNGFQFRDDDIVIATYAKTGCPPALIKANTKQPQQRSGKKEDQEKK